MSDFTSIEALFDKYFEEINQVVPKGIIGVAAPVIDDEIRFTNNEIKFNHKTLKNKMFPEGLMVLNDLELQAYAIEGLSNDEIIRIGQVKEEKKGSKVLISPGTGLGLAGVVDTKVIFTEGGHLNIPPDSLELEDLLKKFNEDKGRPPTFEDLLSGKGINYCKYIALIWGATSGVFLSGSIANTLLKPEDLDTFRNDFESSKTMQGLLKIMPVFLIKDTNLGLKGGLILASKG